MNHPGHSIEVFFDGDCPLCLREINMLRRFNRRDLILFTDIADSSFDPSAYSKTLAELMDHIHGRLPDGSWITGVEVFRQLYSAVGLAPLVTLTRLPGIDRLLDWGYERFAKNRLRWTGRCTSESCDLHAAASEAL